MSGYRKNLEILAEHCDFQRKLKPSSLLSFVQEMCIADTTRLGYGREKTLDKGYLWIINRERFFLYRRPEYGEKVTLFTKPLSMLHFFFPRYVSLADEEGNLLVESVSLWSLIDQNTREFIDPIKKGIIIKGEKGDYPSPMFSLKHQAEGKNTYIQALYDRSDLNGHLNNAGYAAMAMNHVPLDYLKSHALVGMDFSFLHEIPLGKKIKMRYGEEKEGYYFSSKDFFIRLSFKEMPR